MSWLSDRTGIHLGNVGAPIGAVLGSLVGMPTVGAALGQGVGALGQGKSVGQAIGQGAAVYGAGKALAPLVRAIPGIGSVIPDIGGASGGNGTIADASTGGMPSEGGGGWSDLLSGVTRALGGGGSGGGSGGAGGGGLYDLALAGLATAQGVNAANASKRAGDYQGKAIDLAEKNWAAGAPLRTAGSTQLLTPKATNLSSVYADPTNPFAPRVRRIA